MLSVCTTLLREVRLRFGRKNENFWIFILSFSHLALTLLREVRLHLSKAKLKKIPFFILLCFRFALTLFRIRKQCILQQIKTMATTPEFKYAPMFQLGKDTTEYRLIGKEGVSTGEFEGKTILKVSKEALTQLAQQAFHDVEFMLRREHNLQVAKILSDPEASENDKYVALQFLRNAETAAKGILPFCQDTGTAIIHGEKGQRVWTDFEDEEALSLGVYNT